MPPEPFDVSDVPEPPPAAALLPFPELTPREREVALRIAQGDSCRDVARLLQISVKTADTHRGHLMKKLQVRHAVDLCRLAIRRGYIAP